MTYKNLIYKKIILSRNHNELNGWDVDATFCADPINIY